MFVDLLHIRRKIISAELYFLCDYGVVIERWCQFQKRGRIDILHLNTGTIMLAAQKE